MRRKEICTICGEPVDNPVYRRFRRYINFPAHASLDECQKHLIEKNYRTLFEGLYPFVQRTAKVPEEHWHLIEEDFFNPRNAAENSTKFIDAFYDDYDPADQTTWHGTALWKEIAAFIDAVYPPAQLVVPKLADMRPVTLRVPAGTFQRLLAYELKENGGAEVPMLLSRTSRRLFDAFQTGKMPFSSPYYDDQALPIAKNGYMILVPAELDDVLLELPLTSYERRYDSVFTAFAYMLDTSPISESVAFQVMQRKISVSTAVKRISRTEKPIVTNCLKVDGLPDNKHEKLRKVLTSSELIGKAVQLTQNLKEGEKTSIRLDYPTHCQLREIANEHRVPLYKLVTACLIVDDDA